MSKITNNGCFIAGSVWQQWASEFNVSHHRRHIKRREKTAWVSLLFGSLALWHADDNSLDLSTRPHQQSTLKRCSHCARYRTMSL